MPKFEYLSPVRVCGKCSKTCWKPEALVQAILNNDVSEVSEYVSLQNNCMLHTGLLSPLMLAASDGCSEICRITPTWSDPDRIHGAFLRALYILAHRRTLKYFANMGEAERGKDDLEK